MTNMPQYIKETAGGIEVRVYVCPRASKNSIDGEHNGSLKIRLTSPPVDGEANAALTEFIAKTCNVAKSHVAIKNGASSRRKAVFIDGITTADFVKAAVSGRNQKAPIK